MNKPQLSAEMEKRFDEEFDYRKTTGYQGDGAIPTPDLDDIKHFLATAITEERKKVIEEVLGKVEEILPYGAGFTGRFYTLKDEVLNQLKGKT
jgi:hypothetical protein